jgi:hypothetical protein
VFSLACDAVVTLTFVGTLYGIPESTDPTIVTVGINVQNAAMLGALAATEYVPPSAGLTDTSVVPITASFTGTFSPGTYAAFVNLIGSVSTNINITGVLTITSVKRYA